MISPRRASEDAKVGAAKEGEWAVDNVSKEKIEKMVQGQICTSR